jgi:iron(II)-dependent oxidoreductase
VKSGDTHSSEDRSAAPVPPRGDHPTDSIETLRTVSRKPLAPASQRTPDDLAATLVERGLWLNAWLRRIPDAWLEENAHPDLGPGLWDLGHLAAYEDRWLVRALGGERTPGPPLIADPDTEFDAFERPRTQRRSTTLPEREALEDYRRRVRAASLEHVARCAGAPEASFAVQLIVQHEAQHLEILAQGLAARGRREAALEWDAPWSADATAAFAIDDRERRHVPGGLVPLGRELGHEPFDCEAPEHRVEVADFAIDRYPVSCGRYAEFVRAGGYLDERCWSPEGWRWRTEQDVRAPLGWRLPEGEAGEIRLRRWGRERDLPVAEPVVHLSWHEASAFARFEGGSLPSEAEWEWAARGAKPSLDPLFDLDFERGAPVPLGHLPASASDCGVEQMLGGVYEWTRDEFRGYPGFVPHPYPEYSAVFSGRGYRSLRGASFAAGRPLARRTYRNWDWPDRRQIFAGLRLVWSA